MRTRKPSGGQEGQEEWSALRNLVTDRESSSLIQSSPRVGHSTKELTTWSQPSTMQKLPRIMVEKRDALAAILEHEVEDWEEVSKRAPGLTSKRQKLFASLRVALGNKSPTKRQSRGMSLIEGPQAWV